MDAYSPVAQTVIPHVSSSVEDQPWRTMAGTQTVLWHAGPSAIRGTGYSSIKKPITFFLVDAPELAGLERLRAFKTWSDNWDAEGAKAPDPNLIDVASQVFSLLSVRRVPQVTLTADGHPMFVYGAPLQGEVVVTDLNKIDYFFAEENAPSDEDVAFDGSSLPLELLHYIEASTA